MTPEQIKEAAREIGMMIFHSCAGVKSDEYQVGIETILSRYSEPEPGVEDLPPSHEIRSAKITSAPQPSGIEERASQFIEENYDWDKSGRGYINKATGKLALIHHVAAAFAQQETAQQRKLALDWEARAKASDRAFAKALAQYNSARDLVIELTGRVATVSATEAERDQWRKKCGALEESAPWRVSDETIENIERLRTKLETIERETILSCARVVASYNSDEKLQEIIKGCAEASKAGEPIKSTVSDKAGTSIPEDDGA